jgi:carbamoyltransferase
LTAILGLSAYYHDSAAALIVDGDIVAAAQEERFTRVKHDQRFPLHAVRYCLAEAGIAANDLDYVVFYEKPLQKFDRLLETYFAFAPSGLRSFSRAAPLWLKTKLHIPRLLRRDLGISKSVPVAFVDHHESHAASAFFPSPFAEAAIVTLDGVGEWTTASIGRGAGNRVDLLARIRFPHSLGLLYSAFTYYCGFKVNSGEYKLMGLAPYGKPVYANLIRERVIDVKDDGSFWMDMTYFGYPTGLRMTSSKFHDLFGGPPRDPESPILQRHMDLAASIQAVTEEAMMKVARRAHELTGSRNLVLAGGVALNCVANGKLLRNGPFDDVWIQPAAGDAGGALGAALFVWHQLLDHPRAPGRIDAQKGSFLGPRATTDDIVSLFDREGVPAERLDDETELLQRVVDQLADEKIVGWFQGRMEFGPRALGARSILGDPRSPRMQAAMNLKVKFRESFRPFAPAVLRERAHEWFDFPAGHESPYMLLVADVLDRRRIPLTDEERERMERDPDLRRRVNVARSVIPAVTHVDYSARLQTVDRERNPRFHALLEAFHQRTGCPVLVNTSFNVRGEPIVCTPADALRCFLATEIDVLVIENFIVRKDAAQPLNAAAREAHLAKFELD